VHNFEMLALIESTSKTACNSHSEDNKLIKATDLQKKLTCMPPPGLEAYLSPVAFDHPGSKVVSGSTSTVAGILLELVTIATQIANLDKMMDAVRGSAPTESSEAQHWHKVSMQALEMSHKALHEKQMTLLQSLTSVTGADTFNDTLPSIPNQTAALVSSPKAMDNTMDKAMDAMFGVPKKAQSECSTTISDDAISDSGRPESVTSSMFETEECREQPMEANVENQTDLNQSMRLQLEKLKGYPNGHSLIVRKIKPLGFESGAVLKEHFEQYGRVAEVLVAHSITKPSAKRSKGRVRPATLGFVIMAELEGANAALAAGEKQAITAATPCVIEVGSHQPASNLESEVAPTDAA